jgi:hypothetical protein
MDRDVNAAALAVGEPYRDSREVNTDLTGGGGS